MTLHEPATLVTDYLLAALAAGLAWRLHHSHLRRDHPAIRWWVRSLGLTAASAIIGGSYHGFAPNLSPGLAAAWWRLTLLTINLMSAAMAMSWVCEVLPAHRWKFGGAVVGGKFLVFATLVMFRPLFPIAIADYGLVMLAWLGAALGLRRAWRGWMLTALSLSAIAAAVQQLHLAPSARFNHNDLYHVIQALALVAFYRAARFHSAPVSTFDKKS